MENATRVSVELETQGFISLDKVPKQQHARSSNNITEWTQQLHTTIKEQWQNRFGPRYSEVKVLLTFWEADDLGVIKEIAMLDQVFTDFYRYDVSVYRIPNQNSDRELKQQVIWFVTNNGRPETLLVFYYGGHSSIDQQRNETYWTANRSRNSPTLPASGVQSLFEGAWCDALLLYDSCHSATAAITNTVGSGGVTELVAACGFESKAAEVDKHSFSNALAQALVVSSQGPPFSVAELHSRTLLQLKNWTPAPMRDGQGRFICDEDGRPLLDPQRRRTPVHVSLTHERHRRHILLAPFPRRAHDGRILSNHFPPPVLSKDLAMALGSKGSSTPSVSIRSTTSKEQNSELVISVKLRNDLPGADGEMVTQAWVDWLRSAPPEAEDFIEISVKEPSPSKYFDSGSYGNQRDVDSLGLAQSFSKTNGQRKLPSFPRFDLYQNLLEDFATRRMRVNNWLQHITFQSRLDSVHLTSTLQEILMLENQQMPSNWAQLIVAYWELDEAAKPHLRYEGLNESDDEESWIVGLPKDGDDESSVATPVPPPPSKPHPYSQSPSDDKGG